MQGVCQETRNRIMLSLYAYAYEFENTSLVSDNEYDKLSYLIDITKKTGNKKLDKFFVEHFNPCTGQWIHKHPELDKLKQRYNRLYATPINILDI